MRRARTLRDPYRHFGDAAPCGVLHPAVAEAAHRSGAQAVGLVDVGGAAGLDLQVDRIGVRFGRGPTLGT